MKKKMLQFVDLKQETPEKRGTDKRKDDSGMVVVKV